MKDYTFLGEVASVPVSQPLLSQLDRAYDQMLICVEGGLNETSIPVCPLCFWLERHEQSPIPRPKSQTD